jgi:hypothetical protein
LSHSFTTDNQSERFNFTNAGASTLTMNTIEVLPVPNDSFIIYDRTCNANTVLGVGDTCFIEMKYVGSGGTSGNITINYTSSGRARNPVTVTFIKP